jgi:exodeoxyribonuclease V gamma subunit
MLILHQSNRLEILAQRLSKLLRSPVGSPLAAETVVVQHPGMARWLSLQIADHLGIAANLEFPLPAGFIWQVFHKLLPELPQEDRYQPDRLTWRIYQVLTKLEDSHLYRPVNDYLSEADEVKRLQLADQLAMLLDRYLVYRPDWILAWEAGEQAIPGDEWQADLWRRLSKQEPNHWVRQQQTFFDRTGESNELQLPPRVFIFGVPTLSPGYLQILHHLSDLIDIHLFLLNPCEAHWAEIVSEKTQAKMEISQPEAQLYLEVGHPLLAGLGSQGRDFFAAINELDPGSDSDYRTVEDGTLLQQLQNQILKLESPQLFEMKDDSILFHLCHSPMREVEVLYDQLLAMFESMPGLTPSDVLVMSPEIDRYAPLIDAVFSEPGERPVIPFRISDRSLVETNSFATTFLEILQLPGSRYGVGSMLSLLENPAIARRFKLDQLALDEIGDWLQMASIRWGRDGESKSLLGLPGESRHTWKAGLERLILGFAMPAESDASWQGILPLDSVEGGSADRLGGLISLCDAIFGLETQLFDSKTLIEWEQLLLGLVDRFFLPDEESQGDADRLREQIHQLASTASEAGFSDEVSLDLIHYQLQKLLAAPERQGFLGGGVNFCSLAPMRSLPFRVICLLGMSDGAFPRRQPELGFDLMLRDFRFGDRSRRADDRYLFLETLISAQEKLYISYVARHQRDNSELPPSVVVDELRDSLRQMIGESGLDDITHQHPLQPFSPEYFSDSSRLFSYSQQYREAAMLSGHGNQERSTLLKRALDIDEDVEPSLTLDELVNFFINPPRAFVRERLLLNLQTADSLPDEREPFSLDGFERRDLELALVRSLSEGREPDELFEAMDAAGHLPHGVSGRIEFQGMLSSAQSIVDRLQQLQQDEEIRAIEIEQLIDGTRISGRLAEISGNDLIAFTTGKFYPFQLVAHWVRHLAINLVTTKEAGVTHLLEQGGQGRFQPVTDAEAHLESLLGYYRQGHRSPLCFYPATSWAYVETLQAGDEEKAMSKALGKWYGNKMVQGDGAKPFNKLLWPDDSFFGTEFVATAEGILQPLFDHLEWE